MKISKNFWKSEFDSKDGAKMPLRVLNNILDLARQLQVLRDYTGRRITVTSGYRSPEHNKKVGGVSNSQHLEGKAADIQVKGMRPMAVFRVIERLINDGKMKQGGLGLYNNFVHYDIRGEKARWDFRI
jgi:uncharacterized protein YcbK (DUF882 family)